MTDYLLNDQDMMDLCGDSTKIISYEELYDYDDLEDLFDDGTDNVIILYVQDKRGNSVSGHWCCLTQLDDKYIFTDFYGYMPDSQLNFNDKFDNRRFNQHHTILTKMLLEHAKNGGKVEYNEKRFQEKDEDVSTCGRWVSLWARYGRAMGLKKFQNEFEKLRKEGINLDDAVVYLTDRIMGRKLR